MNVSTEQIEIIHEYVDRCKVTIPTLKDDLIDHLCCEVELKLEHGKPFDVCLNEALAELAPKGLTKIQRDTIWLLNSKKMIHMKRLTYLIGMVATMAMSFGWLLRTLRMGELGNAVFAFGALGFVAIFLPLLAIHYFKDNVNKSWALKLRFVTGVLSVIFVGIAVLFKIMHMPGADEVLWMGGSLFTFGFLPSLFFNFYRKSISQPEHDNS
jgi:hypothetical protein